MDPTYEELQSVITVLAFLLYGICLYLVAAPIDECGSCAHCRLRRTEKDKELRKSALSWLARSFLDVRLQHPQQFDRCGVRSRRTRRRRDVECSRVHGASQEVAITPRGSAVYTLAMNP